VSSLSESKVELLYIKALEAISNSVFSAPLDSEKEPAFTNRVVLPFVSAWVKSLNENGLHVRGDGGLNPLRLVWDEVSFYPDITIMNFQDRLVSYEVKFLRMEDPGGSLTKAIGQTMIYEKAGFASSIGVIIDCRKLQNSHSKVRYSETIHLSERATALIFKPDL
jgi:hypothetical protein